MMVYDNPLVAYIDGEALKHNINIVRTLHPGREIILPVKADGYGHDSVIISKTALECGVNIFAVARADEGVVLRNAGINARVIVLGTELVSNFKYSLDNDIELSFSDCESLSEYERLSCECSKTAVVHLLVDTGMSRLGFDLNDFPKALNIIRKSRFLKLSGIFTHFARSDESVESIEEQIKIFSKARKTALDNNMEAEFYHCSNSGGVENYAGPDWANAVRPGIMVYGYSQKIGSKSDLKPVMTLTAKVLHVKDVEGDRPVGYGHTFRTKKKVRLATIGIGYADGLMRICSNNITFRINGRDYHQCGRVSMDLTVVETDHFVNAGDTAVIFGDYEYALLNADDIAKRAGTICYEVLTSVGNRVKRILGRPFE